MTNPQLSDPDFILVIAGPTACGKSAFALELCEEIQKIRPAEILCADSITVYKGFDIGSAKPDAADRARIPHHLLDLCAPTDSFTASDFANAARKVISQLHKDGKIPVLVGGAGFYLRALLQGMTEQSEEQTQKSIAVKARLEKECEEEGLTTLYKRMLSLDPALQGNIHLNDRYRVLRALQAIESTGKLWSELNAEARAREPLYKNIRYFCIEMERVELLQRVEKRTKKMLDLGIIEETKGLLNSGVPRDSKPMQSVGYKETLAYLEGQIPLAELPPLLTQETMRLAKRQRTLFRGEKRAEWSNYSAIRKSLMLE